MSFPTNWDVNKYHDPSEFNEHWNLRKQFMLTHKNQFPEDRLAGLAKIFYNMEFLGCVYNSELMILVQNLARQVDAIVEYRNKKKMKLQRTFVKASDAVKRHIEKSNTITSNPKVDYVNFVAAKNNQNEDKAENKRLKIDEIIEKPELQKIAENLIPRQNFIESKPIKQHMTQNQFMSKPQQLQQPQPGTLSKTQQRKQAKQQLKQRNQEKDRYKLRFDLKPEDRNLIMKVKNQNGILGKLVLYETQAHATSYGRLYYAASKINVNMKIEKDEANNKYILYMDNEHITEIPIPEQPAENRKIPKGHRKNKVPEEARNLIGDKAIAHLKKYCFTLIDHNTKDFEQISTDNLKNNKGQQKQQFELSMDGIGAKMMKQMGWGGKGLGKDATGIIEPIQAEIRVYRRGFGQGSDEAFTKSIREYFENYLSCGETKRLVFSTDFSKDDRAKLHFIAGQYGLLRSRSYGQGDNRHITIERKLSGWDIIEQVLANGGSNDCYSLIKPTNIH